MFVFIRFQQIQLHHSILEIKQTSNPLSTLSIHTTARCTEHAFQLGWQSPTFTQFHNYSANKTFWPPHSPTPIIQQPQTIKTHYASIAAACRYRSHRGRARRKMRRPATAVKRSASAIKRVELMCCDPIYRSNSKRTVLC